MRETEANATLAVAFFMALRPLLLLPKLKLGAPMFILCGHPFVK